MNEINVAGFLRAACFGTLAVDQLLIVANELRYEGKNGLADLAFEELKRRLRVTL
jgi:hypothetical protein